MYTIHPEAESMFQEKNFNLFKHAGMYCALSRMQMFGNLNGYVAVQESHPLYGKEYNSEVVVGDMEGVKFNGNYIGLLCSDPDKAKAGILQIDMALDVYCGITYSRDHLYNIEEGILPPLWWFGFDTAHSGDLKPFQSEIDRKYHFSGYTYKNEQFVTDEIKKLAEQLSKYSTPKSS